MSECTHDCNTCAGGCGSSDGAPQDKTSFLEPLNSASKVEHVYAIMSGKGGVGKSLITSLMAVAFQKAGKNTAILDADITGPSIPKAFGLDSEMLMTTDDGTLIIPSVSMNGTQIISSNLLLENNTDPIIWRGSLIASCVKQFWSEAYWENVDYMFVDMPPGTGDVPLTVFQSLPVDGIIIVTSPQDLVSMIVQKAVVMAQKMEIPVVGIVENMSYFQCPDCGKKHYIYGESKTDEVAAQYGIPVIAKIPIDPHIAEMVDAGKIEYLDTAFLDKAVKDMILVDSAAVKASK